LDAALRVQRLHRVDEFVDKRHVFFAAHAVLAQPEIERVVEQHLVVRANVQNDRQTVLRRHTGAGGIECELAERYAHPAGAEITQAKDALAVGHHDEAYILFRPVAEDLPDTTAGVDRQIHAARLTEYMSELLTRLPDRRRIDERQVRGRVGHHDRVEQRLVAGLQVCQNEILLQIAIEVGDLGVPARHLQLDIGDGGWQQAFETIRATLCGSERRAFVQPRVMKKLIAGEVLL
jgi:hypothetical protein